MTPLVVQLESAGPGGTLAERFRDGKAAVASEVNLVVRAVVVELVPVPDGRPDPVAVRKALKRLRRQAGLAAHWNARAGRPHPRPGRKAKARQRASHATGGASGRSGSTPESDDAGEGVVAAGVPQPAVPA